MHQCCHRFAQWTLGLAIILISLTGQPAAAADQPPLLADAPANKLWFPPDAAEQLTWVGTQDDAPPVLVLSKQAVAQQSLLLHLQTDARQLLLQSGDEQLAIELRGDRSHRLLMRAHGDHPALELNGHELGTLRGRWIRLAVLDETPTITLQFDEASYANLTLEQPDARPTLHHVSSSPAASDAGSETSAGVADDQAVVLPAPVPGSVLDQRPERLPLAASSLPPARVSASPGGTTAAASTAAQPHTLRPDAPPATNPYQGSDPSHVSAAAPTRFATPDARIGDEFDHTYRWRLNLDAGVDYLSAYYYRGFAREDEDLILQPWTDLTLNVFENRTPFILNYVDALFGIRSSHHWGPSAGGTGEKWFELQWYGGLEVGVFNRWRAGIAYVNVENIDTAYRDVHQFDLWVGYDDSDPNHDWSLQPYVLLSFEYENQSDAGWLSRANSRDPRFSTGTYLELGVRPRFSLFNLHLDEPVTLTVPAKVGFSLSDYYEDTQGDDRFFGYASVGMDFGIPLARIAGEGRRRFLWQLNAGVELLYLGNAARDVNDALGYGDDAFVVVGKVGLSLNY